MMDSTSPPHIGLREWNIYDPRTWLGHSPFEGIGFENESDITAHDYNVMDKYMLDSYKYVFY